VFTVEGARGARCRLLDYVAVRATRSSTQSTRSRTAWIYSRGNIMARTAVAAEGSRTTFDRDDADRQHRKIQTSGVRCGPPASAT
jgi:hypothetical protein